MMLKKSMWWYGNVVIKSYMQNVLFKKHYFIFICVFMRRKFKGYKTDISDYFWSVVEMSP